MNARLRFRRADGRSGARVQLARELMDSDDPAHQRGGRVLYAAEQRQARLEQRDEELAAGRHPGAAEGRYEAARAYAARWGLPAHGT